MNIKWISSGFRRSQFRSNHLLNWSDKLIMANSPLTTIHCIIHLCRCRNVHKMLNTFSHWSLGSFRTTLREETCLSAQRVAIILGSVHYLWQVLPGWVRALPEQVQALPGWVRALPEQVQTSPGVSYFNIPEEVQNAHSGMVILIRISAWGSYKAHLMVLMVKATTRCWCCSAT